MFRTLKLPPEFVSFAIILAGLTVGASAENGRVFAEDEAAAVSIAVAPSLPTDVNYHIKITGEIVTPSPDGSRRFPLTSSGTFRFVNHPCPSDLGGPFSLRAARIFEAAATTTTVGDNHTTKVVLPQAYRTIHVFGSDRGLLQVSPKYSLPRKQLDLLQMPFDVLAAASLLPSTAVRTGDKWNTDAWAVPLMTGIEAVVQQSATCTLESISDSTAMVTFGGKINGAVQGSSADVSFSGRLTIDRTSGMIASFTANQKELRSPGPVSPGLEVTVEVSWQQKPVADPKLAVDVLTDTTPAENQLLLFLQTPLKLQLRHSREWHLFHETPDVLMMRQLRDGNLISQCNIAAAVTVPPKQHTPDKEFLADVQAAVQERKGRVLKKQTVRDDARWRIRHVSAVGNADEEVIIWDYYLCTAASGEQYSIVFSHSQNDDQQFSDTASRILSTLQVARPRPILPFR